MKSLSNAAEKQHKNELKRYLFGNQMDMSNGNRSDFNKVIDVAGVEDPSRNGQEVEMTNTDYAFKSFIEKCTGNSRVNKVRKLTCRPSRGEANFLFVFFYIHIYFFRMEKSKHSFV